MHNSLLEQLPDAYMVVVAAVVTFTIISLVVILGTVPALPLTDCVTSGKVLNFSVPLFPHL